MNKRKKGGYFEQCPGDPLKVSVRIMRRTAFNEADVMGIAWHGHYARFFEEASAELGRKCGLSYLDYYQAGVQAPIVQLHVDYHQPLMLEEVFTVEASYIWSEGSRLHTEFVITRENQSVAAAGYTVQMFMSPVTKEPILASPPILEDFRARWRSGAFH